MFAGTTLHLPGVADEIVTKVKEKGGIVVTSNEMEQVFSTIFLIS